MLSVVRAKPSASNSTIMQLAIDLLAKKHSNARMIAFSDVPVGHYFIMKNKSIYRKFSSTSGIREDLYQQGSSRGMSIWPQSLEVLYLEEYSRLLQENEAKTLASSDAWELIAIAIWAILGTAKAN